MTWDCLPETLVTTGNPIVFQAGVSSPGIYVFLGHRSTLGVLSERMLALTSRISLV